MRKIPGAVKSALSVLMALLLLAGCAETEVTGESGNAALPALESRQPEAWASADSPSAPAESAALPTIHFDGTNPFADLPTLESQSGAADPVRPTVPMNPATPSPSGPSAPTGSDDPNDPADPDDSAEELDLPVDDDSKEDAPAAEPSPLEGVLTDELKKLDGTWSVYVRNLDTGETVSVNERPMVAASLIKLFVAGAYYQTDKQASDAAWCAKTDVMISASSNEACNALIDRLGKSAINRFIRDLGCEHTELNRKMLEKSSQENYTSPRECGEVLEAILNGKYVSSAASKRLLENLKAQERTGKIPAGVPAGVETANKTGELSDTENDACIVWSDGATYILCVMSNEQTNAAKAREEIVAISRLVYEYFNP